MKSFNKMSRFLPISIFSLSRRSTRQTGLKTKAVQRVSLPVNFEGELRIITSNPNSTCGLELEIPSAVHVFEVLDSSGKYFPASNSGHNTVCGGFVYTTEDRELWKSHMKTRPMRKADWLAKLESQKSLLLTEHDEHKDILFVDIVDVYTNLVWKTLFFLEWALTKGYGFVLKTDDDVFLDIPKIVEELYTEREEHWDWWSCFKVGWPAPNAGKWRDRLSLKRTYPPFPSGSGYVLRIEAVAKMLARQYPENPVGEDVSVGLLADGLNLKLLQESSCYWSCDQNCSQTPCNAPGLDAEKMKNTWQSYVTCNEICDCPT